jgi:hypothetical protein
MNTAVDVMAVLELDDNRRCAGDGPGTRPNGAFMDASTPSHTDWQFLALPDLVLAAQV